MMNSRPLIIVTIALSSLVFVALQTLNFLAADPANSGGLFLRGISNVSALYPVDITPIGATFAIWGVIYAWQAAIILYALTSLCRKTPEGPVYCNPVLLPASFYFFYILNNISNIVWLFLWDRLHLVAAAVFLFLIAITLYVCIAISYVTLNRNINVLIEDGRRSESWLIIFIVQNGLGIYAAWTSIASLINLAVALGYTTELGPTKASTISLIILTVAISVYVASDLSVLNIYSRYVFTPYLVFIVALLGVIAKNWNPMSFNSIFTVMLLSISLLAAILKFVRLTGTWGSSNSPVKYKPTFDVDYRIMK